MRFPYGYLVTALVLAGCAAPEAPRVPSAQQREPGGVPSASAPATVGDPDSDFDKALRYTRCMTDHGATHPDPEVGKALVTYNMMDLQETGGDTAKLAALMEIRTQAHSQCKQLLPATWPIWVDPAEIARSRAFGVCLREHGVETAEPDANGMVNYPTDSSIWETPLYQSAVDACRHLVDDPANKVQS
jgi:hypothetical protein